MTNDLIADFLTRIRNATVRKKLTIITPSSKVIVALAKILESEGFINSFEVESGEVDDKLTIKLKYINGISSVTKLERISRPGLRKYTGYKEIKKVLNGIGISIISTSKGLMTGKLARHEHLGGEILANIY